MLQPLATVAPLILGGLIYILFRPTSLFMFAWFGYVGVSPIIAGWRATFHPLPSSLPDWAVYSFPQAAWVWFGTMVLLRVWEQSHSFPGRVWVLVPCLLAVSGEVAQGFHLLPGTFDAIDIVFSVLALFSALTFRLSSRKRQHA